jgi:hypothetical protein
MSKGQKRSSREPKKPKQKAKGKALVAASSFATAKGPSATPVAKKT